MTNRNRGTRVVALAAVAIAAQGAPAASADPVSVNLRVEGVTGTIFEGPVTTDVHPVSTPSDPQPRTCDGTGAGNPSGPTATGALDDASRLAGFGWDGTWDDGFKDYYYDRIGPDRINRATHYWSLWINWDFASAGGCGQPVEHGDEVLWAYEDFTQSPLLRLTAPASARTGEGFRVKVVDGFDDSPEQDAVVGGATTGADGEATVIFADAGVYRLKAEKPDAIRSNVQVVCVDPPGADPCTSGDKSAPRVLSVDLPGRRLASERGRSRTMIVSWQADDGAGSGLSHYAVEVREMGSGLRSAKVVPGEWKLVTDRTATPSVRFRGDSAKAYRFRVTAVDRAANRGAAETQTIVVPVDDRDRRLWRFSRGWRRTLRAAAWGRTVRRAAKAGATARLPFAGRRVSLIGRRLPRGGRLRVSVGRRGKVVSLRGRSRPRRVLWTSRALRDGPPVLRIRSLGGGPVELDAVAPRP
jgi:hypothetical protein